MILEFYQNIPLSIDPVAFSIGSFDVRWYSVSYVAGFLVTYLFLLKILKNSNFKKDAQISNFQFPIYNEYLKIPNTKYQIPDTIVDFLLISFFAAIVGGRLGYVLLYDFSYFFKNPLDIFLPYKNGIFTGFYGMSYHGALMAIMIATYFFTKYKKIDFWSWADLTAPAATLGYFFGRIGNFLNGELYGKVTDSAVGMYFKGDPLVLRHPSQIYEAFGEGIFLFLFLHYFAKLKQIKKGSVFAMYLVGYGAIRFALENFRQGDISHILSNFSLGQIYSSAMILLGLMIFYLLNFSFDSNVLKKIKNML